MFLELECKHLLYSFHPLFIHPASQSAICSSIHLLTNPSIHPLTNSSIHPPVHPVSQSSVHPSTIIYSLIHSSTHPSIIHLSINPSIYPTTHLSMHLSNHPSIHPPNHPSIHPLIHPSIHLFIYPSIHPSIQTSFLPRSLLSILRSSVELYTFVQIGILFLSLIIGYFYSPHNLALFDCILSPLQSPGITLILLPTITLESC